ncbi:hypothetical protein QZH41_013125 [Actinostola sp. cb2023]|nr:hypothetical protein QZH41_013125 [Actinostola sp. cb2023]
MNDSKYSLNKEEEVTLNSNGPYSPDVMVETNDRRVNRTSGNKRSRIFTLIIILLLVTCAVLIVLYTMERGKRRKAEQQIQEAKSKHFSTGQVCTNEHCVKTASEIVKNLDQEVQPCDDFYLFACGGWKKEHPIPDTDVDWNQVREIKLRISKTLRRLLDSKDARDKYSKSTAVSKVYDFYDACTDIPAIEAAGISPLNITMTKFGSWNITDTGFQGSWNFYTFLTSIHRELNIEPLFKIQVRPDFKNSSIHRIMIKQTSHTITRKSYLTSNDTYIKM